MEPDVQLQMFLEVLIAAGLGALVGLERTLAQKPAGLRTHMIVAAAAALFVELGKAMTLQFQVDFPDSNVTPDPIRIIQAIAVGISFLGAGTVLQIKDEQRIEGLTTAASILFVSGVGMAVAQDMTYLAIALALLLIMCNWLMRHLEGWIERRAGIPAEHAEKHISSGADPT